MIFLASSAGKSIDDPIQPMPAQLTRPLRGCLEPRMAFSKTEYVVSRHEMLQPW